MLPKESKYVQKCQTIPFKGVRYLLRGVVRPDKLLSRAKALVPQGHGGVDDVLPVSAHHHEPAQTQRNKMRIFNISNKDDIIQITTARASEGGHAHLVPALTTVGSIPTVQSRFNLD